MSKGTRTIMVDTFDFTSISGREVLDRLSGMPARKRRKVARTLIYKKGRRPVDLDDQIVLLDALRKEPALTDFDQFYALIAGSHKVCEALLHEDAAHWLNMLREAEPQIRKMPISYGLRKDRTHLVFSALNVALNLNLFIEENNGPRLADWFFDELDALNPKRMTPYLFNTTSNVVKCAGLVILRKPDAACETVKLMRRLISYSIEISNPIHWWVYSRFQSPARLADVTERSAFGSFVNSMKRLDAMEDVATITDAAGQRDALRKVAGLCVAQANPKQKAALLETVDRILDQHGASGTQRSGI
jgi:hypothetical protein